MRLHMNGSGSLVYLLVCIIITACNISPRNIPFPQQELEYNKPNTEKLIYSEPQKIEWTIINRDSVKPPQTEKFNLEKIASKQIDLGNPGKPYKPLIETGLTWKVCTGYCF